MRGNQALWCFCCLTVIVTLMAGGCPPAFAADEPTSAQAGSTAPTPEAEAGRPTIEAVYVDTAPAIDGQLDDPCWAEATRVKGFYCSEWDAPAPEETIALICADGEGVYVAVICSDGTPDPRLTGFTERVVLKLIWAL